MTAPTVSPAPLAANLEEACRRWSERPAVTFGESTLSYGELWQRVSSLAASYLELGVRPGDRIVCQLPNGIEHVVAIGAAWAVGALHVGTDNDLTPDELVVLLDQVDASALLYQPRADGPDVPGALARIREGRPGTSLLANIAEPPDGVHRLDDLLHREVAVGVGLPPYPDPEQTAVLHLTSGTTGRSKAVKETHTASWAKMQFFADAYRPEPDDVHLVFQPIAHVFGMRLALIPLLTGGRLVLLDRFTPEGALRLVGEQGVTVLPGMPTHFTLMLRVLDPARHRVDTLRWAISAATALPAGLADEIHDRFGVEMMYVFGCAEGFTTRTTDRSEIARGSVGRTVFRSPGGKPQDGRVRIIDPADNRPLPAGEVGEIVFGAATPVQYWGAPDAATDGWYHTGDLGRIDPDGCLFLVGRLKELINRGGLKVAPSEIEAAIVRHDGIVDAGVVATPDPVLGEAICACIMPAAPASDGPGDEPADGRAPDLTELRTFLADLLARHKLPDELCAIPRVPRTKIGKVDRQLLTELVVHQEVPVERWRPR